MLDQLGGVYLYWLSRPEKARTYFLEALKVAEPLDIPLLKAEVFAGLGQCAFRMLEASKALDYYNQALTFVPKFANSAGREGSLLFNIAQINLLLDQVESARQNLARARPLAKAAREPILEATIVQSMADIAERDGDIKLAVALNNEAGTILMSQPDAAKEVVDWLATYAMLCLRNGVTKEPIEYLTKTIPNARDIGYTFGEANLLDTLGVAYFITGDYIKAVDSYNKALFIFRTLGLKPREARSLENLMTAWDKLGNPKLAIFFGKNAVNIYQSIRSSSSGLSSDQQKAFSDNFATAYRSLSEVLIQQGRIAEAEQVLTLLKQQELLQFVRRDDTVAKELLATLSVSDEERVAIARYAEIAEQITMLGKEFDELDTERKQSTLENFPKQKRYDEVKQLLTDATLTFQKFLDGLKVTFGQNDTRVKEISSSLKKTLERLRADRTAAVSTIVGKDTLNIIVTTSRTQRAHTLKVTEGEINDLVGAFRKTLTSPQYDPRPASQKLYDLIVKPIEGDLAGIKADTIVWSLDGSLRYIPPAALWDKEKGYLVERFANVIVNLANRASVEKDPMNTKQLSILGVGVSKPVEGFAPLAAVPDELDCIVSDKSAGILSAKPQCSTGLLTGRKLLDEKFTLANFEGELGRYPIVHIASHFKLVPGDDKNSFLLLGGGTDRKFTVEKLRSESLGDLELMVLSACNTATPAGTRTNGIEVESFSALAQEEARSVLATLWSVSDPSTKDFMVEFYKLYGAGGISKAVAVRQAQLKLMYGKYSPDEAQKHRADEFVTATDKTLPAFKPDPSAPFAHPFYWSPFTLAGNWR
jgi:CHAT domain-containing protein